MDNTNEMITAALQKDLQHVADVQHELVTTPPQTADQCHELIQNMLGGAVDCDFFNRYVDCK